MKKLSKAEESFPRASKTEWEFSDWYEEWERFAKRDYHGNNTGGYWVCYTNRNGKIQYRYIRSLS